MKSIHRLVPSGLHRVRPARRRLLLVLLSLCTVTGAALASYLIGYQGSTGKTMPELASMLPQGALLTIESTDFAGVLKRWNDSKEKSAWLGSDNFSVFSRSRLFGRLGDAQGEFAHAAGLPPDMNFLSEVAGKRSIFAWYDIGNLEFLYVTQLPSGVAEKTRLMQMRGQFATRQAGGQTFYVRTQGDPNNGGQVRTVAFATSGDWLLLATREDLVAGALTLMNGGNPFNGTASGSAGNSASSSAREANSLAGEPWFKDAHATAHEPGVLRMTLNLAEIVPSPYFRSYWIQRNVSEMKQYRSAVADLWMEDGRLREERVLLPRSLERESAGGLDTDLSRTDLGALTALLPAHAGVYRAVAAPGVEAALGSIDEKLIQLDQHGAGGQGTPGAAPETDLSVEATGSAADLETRVDFGNGAGNESGNGVGETGSDAASSEGDELGALRRLLETSDLQAMMTVGRTGTAVDGIWIPFQSAVVLSSSKDWNALEMQTALQAVLEAHLTTGGLGLTWKAVDGAQGGYSEIGAIRPLQLAVRGKFCILTNDPGLLLEMLGHWKTPGANGLTAGAGASPASATILAGFELPQEKTSFARWSAIVDRSVSTAGHDGGPSEPAFFAGNIRSLGDAFSALENECFMERKDGELTRQTVIYRWRQ